VSELGGIVPRWEWRTFGDDFGPAEAALVGGQEPERAQESDEIYVLSRAADASVKVRDGLMDVKRLEEVNSDGLEQWRPVLKNSFPLSATDVATMLQALGVSAQTTRDDYTLEQLLSDLVEPNPSLAAVDVHKQRAHYSIGGCMAELSEISSGGRSTRTIVVEGEDPELISAAVRELGLQDRPNVCLARGLKTMLGL